MNCKIYIFSLLLFLQNTLVFGDLATIHITGSGAAGGSELASKLAALTNTDTIIEIHIDNDISLSAPLDSITAKEEISILGPSGAPITINATITSSTGLFYLESVDKIICKDVNITSPTATIFDISHAKSIDIQNSSFTAPKAVLLTNCASLYVHSSTFSPPTDHSKADFAFDGTAVGSICIMESTCQSGLLGFVCIRPIPDSLSFPEDLMAETLTLDAAGLFFYKNTIHATTSEKPLLAYISSGAFDIAQFYTAQKSVWKNPGEQEVEKFFSLHTPKPILWCKENTIQNPDSSVYPLIVYNKHYQTAAGTPSGLLYLKHEATTTHISIADVEMTQEAPSRDAEILQDLSDTDALEKLLITTTPTLPHPYDDKKTVSLLCDFGATNPLDSLLTSTPPENAWILCLPGTYSISTSASFPSQLCKISGLAKNKPTQLSFTDKGIRSLFAQIHNLQIIDHSSVITMMFTGKSLQMTDSHCTLSPQTPLFVKDSLRTTPPSIPLPNGGFFYAENCHIEQSSTAPGGASHLPILIQEAPYIQASNSQILADYTFLFLSGPSFINLQNTWLEGRALISLVTSSTPPSPSVTLDLHGGNNTLISSAATILSCNGVFSRDSVTEHSSSSSVIHGPNNAIHIGDGKNCSGLVCICPASDTSQFISAHVNHGYSFCLSAIPIVNVHALPALKYLSPLAQVDVSLAPIGPAEFSYNLFPVMPFLLQGITNSTPPLTLTSTFSQDMFGNTNFQVGTLLQRAEFLGFSLVNTPPPTKKKVTTK